MNGVKALYQRLDAFQRTRAFHIGASVVAFLLVAVLFGALLKDAYNVSSMRNGLREFFSQSSLLDGDPDLVSLRDTGIFQFRGETFGDAFLAQRSDLLFNAESGMVDDIDGAVEGLINLKRAEQAETAMFGGALTAPTWLVERTGTTWLLALVVLVWLLLIIWLDLTIPFLLTLMATAIPLAIGSVLAGNPLWRAGLGKGLPWFLADERWRMFLSGVGLLVFTFILLNRALLVFFSRPNQPMAVAHTVVKEASRIRITFVFIVLLLLLLPLLPVSLDAASPLRFQVQTFISRSLLATYILAACFTLFLACATVAFEIRDRQIWSVMTKPVGKLQYLVGKWLGVMALNLIMLVVAGISTFMYVQYLRERPVAGGAAGQEDRRLLEEAVLTARVGSYPTYDELDSAQLLARVEAELRDNPEYAGQNDIPLSTKRRLADEMFQRFQAESRSIPPGGNTRSYTFERLGNARELQSVLSLNYKFHILRDDEHEQFKAGFTFNGDEESAVDQTYVPTLTHTLPVSSQYVRDNGSMTVDIYNLYFPPQGDSRGSINFDPEGLELLYKVSSFEMNFLRAMLGMWIKLSFLAMLGLACATFLSFPVACLMSFTIFIAAAAGPYLSVSLQEYYPIPRSQVDWSNIAMVIQWAFESLIKLIAQSLVFMLRPFGELRTTQALVEGRLIPMGSVIRGFGVIGVLWTGLSLFVGFLVFRSRQLAIYSGHG